VEQRTANKASRVVTQGLLAEMSAPQPIHRHATKLEV